MLVHMGDGEALAWVRDPAMIPALIEIAQRHSAPRVRVYALRGLSGFMDPAILDLAEDALADSEADVRLAAAYVLGEVGGREHIPILLAAARREASRSVRLAIEAAAAQIGPTVPAAVAGLTVRAAAVQFVSQFGKPEVNRRRLETYIREAARNGAKIVVLPETAIQGYLHSDIRTGWQVEGWTTSKRVRGVSPAHVAEPVPGPSTRAFGSLSKELGIYLTVPILEVEEGSGRYFNTLCLVGPEGGLLLHYRKLHPWPYAERGWASVGDRGLQFLDTPYGRLGLLICYDINFEPAHLRKHGVDILLYSIAWVNNAKSPWFDVRLPRIAKANGLNIIGANWAVPQRPKWHGYGNTCIIDHTGRILARASRDIGEEVVYAGVPIRPRPTDREEP